jgi:hypothetical protein
MKHIGNFVAVLLALFTILVVATFVLLVFQFLS